MRTRLWTCAALLLSCLATAASAGVKAVPGPSKHPSRSAPEDALRQLRRAYETRSLDLLSGVLSADYRFHTSDAMVGQYWLGADRGFELESAGNLFSGQAPGNPGSVSGPPRLMISVGPSARGTDPEHPDSTGQYCVLVAERMEMRVEYRGKPVLHVGPSQHVFHLVRGDAAVLGNGQPADRDHWYIRRWLENVSAVSESLGMQEGDCDESNLSPVPGAGPASAEAGGLAIRPLANPACPALEVMCDVPGTEPVQVDVFDVTGRLANWREVVVERAGSLRIEAGSGARLSPGVYWVRLRQAQLRPSTRMVVVAR